jgi:outer membrane protein assembly factor BamB
MGMTMNHRSMDAIRLLLGVSLLISACQVSHADFVASDTFTPPFKTEWSQLSGPQISHSVISSRSVLYAGPYEVGAFSFATGKPIWSHKDEKYSVVGAADFGGDTVYSALYQFGIQARDSKTGRLQWSMPVKSEINEVRIDNSHLYCELHTGKIAAIDTKTHRVAWETNLSAPETPRKFNSDKIVILENDRVLVTANAKLSASQELTQLFCLSSSTGRILWRSQPVTGENVWPAGQDLDFERVYTALTDKSMLCLRLQDGKTLWRRADVGDSAVINGGHVISTVEGLTKGLVSGSDIISVNGGQINALDAATGKRAWSLTLSKQVEPNVSAPVNVGADLWTIVDETVYCLNSHGRVKWKWSQPGLGRDLIITNRGFLTTVGNTLCLFRHGTPDKLPSDTAGCQALARTLVSRLDKLDPNDQNNLRALGDDAFPALTAELQQRMLAYQANPDKSDSYRRFSDCAKVVAAFAKPKFTPQLLKLLASAKPVHGDESTRQEILSIVAWKGDANLTLPLFIKILKSEKIDWTYTFSAGYAALNVVKQSDAPAATAFLVSVLSDSAADPELRHTAYINAAKTGDPAAVQAVLAARAKQTAASLAEVMQLSKLGQLPDADQDYPVSKLVATAKDAGGRLWGLVNSRAAGSQDDLWIVRSEGDHWVDPMLTTLTPKQLGKPENFLQYINDPKFRADTDGDGWTDLLEQRLGMDPKNKDTDHDGIEDAVDKNPLTKSRSLSETEQILSAAFEAHTWSPEPASPTPALVTFPKGIVPFELIGSNWIILGKPSESKSPLDALYNHGPAFVGFGPPMLNFDGSGYQPKDPNSTVLWNADHTRARVYLRTYYGGLSGTGDDIDLRKFGDDWVVVSDEIRIVS